MKQVMILFIQRVVLVFQIFPENVVRKEKLKIKFLDENLESQTIICSGIIARVIQHEYDHLQGILFHRQTFVQKKKVT
jgi:peptide deformylase